MDEYKDMINAIQNISCEVCPDCNGIYEIQECGIKPIDCDRISNGIRVLEKFLEKREN